jgi:ribosome-binding protein aMBF1 (putative translation factor)
MKEEMELVQNMENTDDRDAEQYTSRLEKLLEIKDAAIQQLYNEVLLFKQAQQEQSAPEKRPSPKSLRK